MAISKVTSGGIADGTLSVEDIADDAVTAAKLANSINTDIATGVTGNTTANAALPKAGGTMTGDINLADNVKAKFGTGNDLEIYHDASHSYIKDVGTGNLYIDGANNIILRTDTGEWFARCEKDAQVALYHNNNKKFETTAAGVTVTGAVTETDSVAGTVLQRVSTQGETWSSGNAIVWDGGDSQISETTAYNSSSLTPLKSLAITAKQANSKFVVELVGKFNITTGYRSQIALQDTYSAGSYTTGNNMYYSHYGLYNNTGGDLYNPGAYRVDDPRALAAGASRTYYWFGGSIGNGTQQYWNLNMSITEVAT